MNIPTRPPSFTPASPTSPAFGVGGGSGIFPHSWDGGIPPNAATPNNPAQAFAPSVGPADTSALYYGNGCDVRLRPHVLNSIISEIIATADRAGVAYRASELQNLERSIRYLIQRGLPRGDAFVEQSAISPFHYAVTLDPRATHYNDYMTLTLVPQMAAGVTAVTLNRGYIRINVNGLGYVPLLRNDGEELKAGDLRHGKPFIAAYFNGAFHHIGLVASQVPLVLVGAIDFWIRTDGNDQTGDGTANSPDKAFRTIDGCWYAVGSRYAGSPAAVINMRLGIPGNYQGGDIGPFGAAVGLHGDVNNPAAYRILTKVGYGGYSLQGSGVNRLYLSGINLVMSAQLGPPVVCLYVGNSACFLDRVHFTIETNNAAGQVILLQGAASMLADNAIQVNGNNHTIMHGIHCTLSSQWPGCGAPGWGTWSWYYLNLTGSGYAVADRSMVGHSSTTVHVTGVTGTRYNVGGFSSLNLYGQQPPGNQPGTSTPQGIVTP